MARRLPGLTKERGIYKMQKTYLGVKITGSTHTSDLQEAEKILLAHMERVKDEVQFGKFTTPTFAEAWARYIAEECPAKSQKQARSTANYTLPVIGALPVDQVHDGTFAGVRAAWRKNELAAGTCNRQLNQVVRVLNLCARKWRHENGKPWLPVAVPLISRESGPEAKPFPLTWEQQDAIIQRMPAYFQTALLFMTATGMRGNVVRELRWDWEVPVPEINASVFLCPGWTNDKAAADEFLLPLNSVASSIVDSQRGLHPTFVFPSPRGNKLGQLSNEMWYRAWEDAGLPVSKDIVRGTHNLRHTFGHRLRRAGVAPEDRADLMWHTTKGDMQRHYGAPEIGRLVEMSEKAVQRTTSTILRSSAHMKAVK